MKTVNKALVPTFEIALRESLKNYESRNERNSLGDLYLYYDEEENILYIYDDTENLLNEILLPDRQPFNSNTVRFVLRQLEQMQFFEKDYISKPFAVSMINRDFNVMEELFFLDNDTIKLEEDMWSHFEKDLDNFMKTLLR